MTKRIIEVLSLLRKYTQLQSKRIDLLEKRLKRLEENKWLNILKTYLMVNLVLGQDGCGLWILFGLH